MFHYAPVEVTHLRRLIGSLGPWDKPLGVRASDLIDSCFVDLHKDLKSHFIGVHGLGLKQVATAVGFEWRDDDPSGEQSQVWLDRARSPGNLDDARAMRSRILEYNEDDVRATAFVRDWLRRQE